MPRANSQIGSRVAGANRSGRPPATARRAANVGGGSSAAGETGSGGSAPRCAAQLAEIRLREPGRQLGLTDRTIWRIFSADVSRFGQEAQRLEHLGLEVLRLVDQRNVVLALLEPRARTRSAAAASRLAARRRQDAELPGVYSRISSKVALGLKEDRARRQGPRSIEQLAEQSGLARPRLADHRDEAFALPGCRSAGSQWSRGRRRSSERNFGSGVCRRASRSARRSSDTFVSRPPVTLKNSAGFSPHRGRCGAAGREPVASEAVRRRERRIAASKTATAGRQFERQSSVGNPEGYRPPGCNFVHVARSRATTPYQRTPPLPHTFIQRCPRTAGRGLVISNRWTPTAAAVASMLRQSGAGAARSVTDDNPNRYRRFFNRSPEGERPCSCSAALSPPPQYGGDQVRAHRDGSPDVRRAGPRSRSAHRSGRGVDLQDTGPSPAWKSVLGLSALSAGKHA